MSKSKLFELVNNIREAKRLYYSSGRSPWTDAEYDAMVKEAEAMGYVETVGAAPVDSIDKIKHEHLMLSLDKCHSVSEVQNFINNQNVIAMDKADGLTCSATYIDGILTRLETRGDGEIGNDVMFHRNSFMNLPQFINKTGKYVIDGECVILWSDFYEMNERLAESERYSHPRNLAAGSLNQLDPAISKKRNLRFYAWDVIEGGRSDSLLDNLFEAKKLGFDVVNFIRCGELSLESIIDLIKVEAEERRFPIDGVVFKYDSLSYGRSLGKTAHHFKNGIAYKYQDDCYPTKLKSVTWQVGKTGTITPVANFDPVDVSGVIVEKASLHNISVMKQLGITNGCTCYIKRSNDVIPQIDHVDYDGDGEIDSPTVCPECGHPTYIDRSGKSEILMCSNDDCPAVLLGKWETFVSKKGMDIDGLSEATLKMFLKRGYLTNMFESIYHLSDYKNEMYNLPGFGKRSVDKLLAAIESSKEVDLVHFLTAFSITNVGPSQAKVISNYFKSFDKFKEALDNQFDFTIIPGFGNITSAQINNWWVNNHMQMLDVEKEIRFKTDNFMNKPEGSYPLAGKTFVITGTLNYYSRKDLQAKIESLGGKCVGSVSKSTSYLINNDVKSSSSKNTKAKQLGVPIISEDEFIKKFFESA